MTEQLTKRVLIFTGDGKGKTTAAFGMVYRALGYDCKIKIIQFIKGNTTTGEMLFSRKNPAVQVEQVGVGFVPPQNHHKFHEHRAAAVRGLEISKEVFSSDDYTLVVLDEICTAIQLHLLDEGDIIDIINNASLPKIIVLTGRGATHNLIQLADTVTEMKCIKHAYESGIKAQKMIEF